MSKLQLKLFGELCFLRGAQRIASFRYDKVRGLLAYLAISDEASHRRESLAHLLWPSSGAEQARSNLRYALFDLRRLLGADADRLLTITRNTLSFRTSLLDAFDYAELFADLPCPRESTGALQALERQAALYGGPLLDGLAVDDAPGFERWLADRREDALGRTLALHERLADHYESIGRWDDALRHVRRQVVLAPWQENDYRRLMKLLAAKGQVSQALQAFESCRRYLAQELGVEPDLATLELANALRESRSILDGRPSSPPLRQQRLPVTALVCRLRLPTDADPDDAVEAFSAPRGLMTEIVAARGGHCVPLHGGVIAAYFGYPVA
ncbi:MAG TPA: BTAD domain-containing putative transcriptional regulator, partial [Rhodocyclaceae bacterium]|nr:BTAD domain-containing putative transcriptional regulator [Rhodocyclaceae bacterium]